MIGTALRRELASALPDAVAFDAPMSRRTSLRVGGPADALALPPTREALSEVLRLCAQHGVPHRVLGRGFNTVVRDEGLDGVAIVLSALRDVHVDEAGLLTAEAGASHAAISACCRDGGWSGLEFAVGIPGTVGGWIAMNAGIPEREMADVVRDVEIVPAGGGPSLRLAASELGFHYRGASGLPVGSVVVAATFALSPSTPAAVRAEMDRHLAHRSATQPLDVPSCGSVFRNPPGEHAGALLDRAGLKGRRVGGACISDTHANFIENRGGASATDVLTLIDQARACVADQSGIALETEVRIFGRPEAQPAGEERT